MPDYPGVFVIKEDGSLVGLSEAPYDSERLLQELLARYPELLVGHELNREAPRRWLLVSREFGIPDEREAADRWSLDHLFLDQEGIPTLVEVKRSSDSRIRREVVGQMLDYAANAVVHWPVERIQAEFEARCEADGRSAEDELLQLLGPGGSPDEFWQAVKTNLQAERVRLLFVSDVIPTELRRVVEFLNRQMDPAEVLAIEVRQYAGNELRTFMPRVLGQTARAEQKKAAGTSSRGRRWDEASFFSKLAERGDQREITVARGLFDWAIRMVARVEFGSGTTMASFTPTHEQGDGWFCPFRVYTGYRAAYAEIPLGGRGMLMAPFDDPAVKLELVQRLNEIPGVALAEDLRRFPSIDLTILAEGDRVKRFLGVVEWALGKVTNHPEL